MAGAQRPQPGCDVPPGAPAGLDGPVGLHRHGLPWRHRRGRAVVASAPRFAIQRLVNGEWETCTFDDNGPDDPYYGMPVIYRSRYLAEQGMAKVTGDRGGFNDRAIQAIATTTRKYVLIALFNVVVEDLPDVDYATAPDPRRTTTPLKT